MALRLIRQQSDTPNVTNKDDVRMIRYAYGNYNGVVKGFGSELESTYDNAIRKFRIGSGRVVLHGWEVDIDEGGWEMTLSLPSGTQYYTVYLEVNALTETAKIKTVYNSYASYPEPDLGDDLTQIPTGTARLILFQFAVHNGNITQSTRLVSTILYLKDWLTSFLEEDHETVKKATIAEKCVPNTSGEGYSGFLRDEDGDITINNYAVRLFEKIKDKSFTVTAFPQVTSLAEIYPGSRYRCKYSAHIPNKGSTQGEISGIFGKYAIRNAQIFTIKIPTSDLNGSTHSTAQVDLYIYRDSTGSMEAFLVTTDSGVQVILTDFEKYSW